jgi:hypothetical protein
MSSNGWTPTDDVATEAWTHEVNRQTDGVIGEEFGDSEDAPLYNRASESLPAALVPLFWKAFPGTIDKKRHLAPEERWAEAEARTEQVEYCEWHSERNADGELMRVTFTTEVPEYFEALHPADPDAVLTLYREWVGEDVQPQDLVDDADNYNRDNPHRQSSEAIVHLQGAFNTLEAALRLAAQAMIVRHDDQGDVISDMAALVKCNGLGDPDRNSDPQIAATLNGAAARRARVSLADPIGPFIEKLRMERMELDDNSLDLADFWQPERAMGDHVVRASFAAPDGVTPLSRVRLEGKPIRIGSQLAERVNVGLAALVAAAGIDPVTGPCNG